MSKAKFAGVASKTIRAMTKLSSWLHASKISYIIENDHFVVFSPDGARPITPHGTQPVVTIYETTPPARGIGLRLDDFWTGDNHQSLRAFNQVTQLLGLGSPNPLPPRAFIEKKELTHHDYWIRHREVNVSPNPDPEVFQKYRPIINGHTNVFYSGNRRLLSEVGLDKDDVRGIIMMWVVSFECIHRMPFDTNNTNCKLLNTHLKQRLIELHCRLEAQSKRIGFDTIPEETFNHKLNNLVYEPVEEPSDDALSALNINDSQERRKVSKSILKDVLMKMPKSFAIKKLQQLVKESTDRSVTSLASKQLAKLLRT